MPDGSDPEKMTTLSELQSNFTATSSLEDKENVDKFMAGVNKQYKAEVATCSSGRPVFPRLMSGALALDLALGGGWPIGKISTIAGPESSGKSLICAMAAAQSEKYDLKTGKHLSEFIEQGNVRDFSKGRTLYVDAEDSLDENWHSQFGYDFDHHVKILPESAQQLADTVDEAIQSSCFNLIVIDSWMALSGLRQLDQSAENDSPMQNSSINNRSLRSWQCRLNSLGQKGIHRPAILILNQFRTEFGVKYGDPNILCGGRALKYASSIIVSTLNPKVIPSSVERGVLQFRGTTKKNKTHPAKKGYEFDMVVREHDGLPVGYVDDVEPLKKLCKSLGWISSADKWTFDGVCYKTQTAFVEALKNDELLFHKTYQKVMTALRGI
jgi:RecA/RadA recombinase